MLPSSACEKYSHRRRLSRVKSAFSTLAVVFVVACLPIMVLSARLSSPAWTSYQSKPSTQNKEAEKKTDRDVAAPQQVSKKDRDRSHRMLDEIKADLKEFYY